MCIFRHDTFETPFLHFQNFIFSYRSGSKNLPEVTEGNEENPADRSEPSSPSTAPSTDLLRAPSPSHIQTTLSVPNVAYVPDIRQWWTESVDSKQKTS